MAVVCSSGVDAGEGGLCSGGVDRCTCCWWWFALAMWILLEAVVAPGAWMSVAFVGCPSSVDVGGRGGLLEWRGCCWSCWLL